MSAAKSPSMVEDEAEPVSPASADPATETPAPTKEPLAVLETEVASLKDQLLRRRAEFDNYRRRVERDQRAASDEAVISLLSDLLPSLDALEKAILAQGSLDEIRAGIEITLKDVNTTLGARGVRQEDPTGEKFDPLRHQALSYEPVPGAEDGTVAVCYRKGYMLGDRLVRPALVKVAQRAPEESDTNVPVSH